MIKIIGKSNCSTCDKIKKLAEESDLGFIYEKNDDKIIEVATDLKNKGQLVEMIAPIILKDGIQIKHKDFEKLL